ncbi:MAG: hypothetical protein LBP56_03050 [Odoribacteraceae bacterium]|jgi:hypothetical protein|nr:hypothetical protein [Odoribacteraceae bacterium]
MKKIFLFIITGVLFSFASCIQDYLEDGGVHDPRVDKTPYDYLATHPYHMFDSIIEIIDHFGLKEEMNQAATVIIPTDFSVKALLAQRTAYLSKLLGDEGVVFSMDSIKQHMTADSVRIYFFQDKIELATAPTTPTEFLSYSGDGSGYAVYRAESTSSSDWKTPGDEITLVTKPYFLYMRKVIGQDIDLLGSTDIPVEEQDITVKCQTTGIICTPTGSVLHVLENSHVFSAFIVRTNQ